MKITSIVFTDKNYQKIKNHKQKLIKTSIGKITFSDALNNLLEIKN